MSVQNLPGDANVGRKANERFYYDKLKENLQGCIEAVLDESNIKTDPGFRSLMLRRAVTLPPNEFLSFLDRLNALIKTDDIEVNPEYLRRLKEINDITFNTEIIDVIEETYDPKVRELIPLKPGEPEAPPCFKIVKKLAAKALLFRDTDIASEVDNELCKNVAQKVVAEQLIDFEKGATEEGVNITEQLGRARIKELQPEPSATTFDRSWRDRAKKVMELPPQIIDEATLEDEELREELLQALAKGEETWEDLIERKAIQEGIYTEVNDYGLKETQKSQKSTEYRPDDSGVQLKIESILKRERDIVQFQKSSQFSQILKKYKEEDQKKLSEQFSFFEKIISERE